VSKDPSGLSELILRHRDSPSPALPMQLPLLRLLDRPGCQMLRDDLAKHGQPWEMRTPAKRTWEMIPDKPGLYMFVWRPWFRFEVAAGRTLDLEQVLYLGQAGAGQYRQATLRGRYKSGYSKYFPGDPARLWDQRDIIQRHDRLESYLTLQPLEYWFTVIEDREEIALLEDRLLQMLNPPINRDRRPKLIRGASRPAFAQN
jgi:hypothetical protein